MIFKNVQLFNFFITIINYKCLLKFLFIFIAIYNLYSLVLRVNEIKQDRNYMINEGVNLVLRLDERVYINTSNLLTIEFVDKNIDGTLL